MSFIASSHWRIALQAGWGLEFAIEGGTSSSVDLQQLHYALRDCDAESSSAAFDINNLKPLAFATADSPGQSACRT
jgi:hypothetical protein